MNVTLMHGRDITSVGQCSAEIMYFLNKDFKVKFVDIADNYYWLYNYLFKENEPLPYNDSGILGHFRKIEYWDGENWVQESVRNRNYSLN